MPTARELLEQADALMRRNREPPGSAPSRVPFSRAGAGSVPGGASRTAGGLGARPSQGGQPPDDLPVLTEVVIEEQALARPESEAPAEADFPLLTDTVELDEAETETGPPTQAPDRETLLAKIDAIYAEVEQESAERALRALAGELAEEGASPDPFEGEEPPAPVGGLEPADGLEIPGAPRDASAPRPDAVAPESGAGDASDHLGLPADHLGFPELTQLGPEYPSDEIVASLDALGAPEARPDAWDEPAAPAAPAGEPLALAEGAAAPRGAAGLSETELESLREQLYFEVLQNLDLYTERVLKEKLAVHLQPVIEQAGRELVAAINANLGVLLRGYISEAIDRQLADAAKRHQPSD